MLAGLAAEVALAQAARGRRSEDDGAMPNLVYGARRPRRLGQALPLLRHRAADDPDGPKTAT